MAIAGIAVQFLSAGTLTNGKVFDSNMGEGKKAPPPLKFKVGVGKVIKANLPLNLLFRKCESRHS